MIRSSWILIRWRNDKNDRAHFGGARKTTTGGRIQGPPRYRGGYGRAGRLEFRSFAVEQNFGQTNIAAEFLGSGNPRTAGILFDNMIAPLIPYGLRGALWCHGESNTDHAARYRGLLQRLIRDWRHVWGTGDYPFLTVQLANFMPPKSCQPDSSWALVREAQLQSLELPETGLAVAIDIGDEIRGGIRCG